MSTSKLEPVLICPDAHHPYVDKRAWALFLKAGRLLKPKHLYCIGDLADMYTVSDHSKDPRRALKLEEELASVHAALDDLDSLKAKHKVFISGNHSDRLSRYLQTKAPELFGLVSIPELFQLGDRGWKYVPYRHDTKLGKCHLTHDVGVAGRNAVFRALDMYQHSIVTGHTHRLQYVVEGNATGEVKLSAMFGWLGDADKIDYMHRMKVYKDWALGFGYGYFNPASGLVYLVPAPIVKYTVCINGRLLEG